MSRTDEQLASEARAGSQRAYREIVERFERPVFNLVVRMVRDRGLAEDLAQDAFVKAFSRLDTFRPEQGKFSSWIFKIAHNTAIDHLRRRQLDTVPIDAGGRDDADFHEILADPGTDTPLESTVHADLAEALGDAIERLRPEYREVVTLRHQEGLTYDEIAHVAELPLGTVKTYLHRARKELATILTEAGWGPEATGGSGYGIETRSPRLA